jgi:flagellar basal-body rod protein FlgB
VSPAYPEADRVLPPCPPHRPLIVDVTSSALHTALNGLAQRQRVTADNIANLQTPGFLAGRVDFETGLRGALADGSTQTAAGGTVRRSMEPTRMDGNNVNLDAETVIATETGLRYQLALNALDGKYGVMRTALRTA